MQSFSTRRREGESNGRKGNVVKASLRSECDGKDSGVGMRGEPVPEAGRERSKWSRAHSAAGHSLSRYTRRVTPGNR